jgi:putative transcription antitermination factor YqgF
MLLLLQLVLQVVLVQPSLLLLSCFVPPLVQRSSAVDAIRSLPLPPFRTLAFVRTRTIRRTQTNPDNNVDTLILRAEEDLSTANNGHSAEQFPKEPLPIETNDNNEFWINVGSTITTDSCPLLGIKCLGVDYGLVRTGIAMSVGYDPIPLAIITQPSSSSAPSASSSVSSSSNTAANVTELCQSIVQYAATYQVQQIIVGLPLHKNGTIAAQTLLTMNFTQQLAVQIVSQLGPNVHIKLFDERYTSKMARAREHSKHPKSSSSSLYGTLDAMAACIILENYYEDHGIGAHPVSLPTQLQEQCVQQYVLSQTLMREEREQRMNHDAEQRRHRLQSIAQAKLLDQEQQQQQQQLLHLSNGTSEGTTKKRKKKKKK